MNNLPERIHLLELCGTDPESANQIVRHAASQPRREYCGIPYAVFLSRPLSADVIGQMVMVQGAVIRVYEVFLKNVTSEQTCMECNASSAFTEAETRQRERRAHCDTCGSRHVKINRRFSEAFTTQSIRIQDIGNSATMAETIEILLEGKDAGRFAPGDKLRVTGAVMRRWKHPRMGEPLASFLYVRAFAVACENPCSAGLHPHGLHLNDLAERSVFSRREFLLSSVCPDIFGAGHAKLAILLALVGGSMEQARPSIHLLLIGGPATGKTHLLRCASKLTSPAIFVNGARTSDAGLTSCAVRQGREWVLEAGALALSDRGACCIDEFERLRVGEKGGLLEAMEQQSISVAKAGIVTSLSTRCSVLAAMRFTKRDISALGLSTPLISRFDFILGLTDDHVPETDTAKCRHIFSRDRQQKGCALLAPAMLKDYLARVKNARVRMTERHSEMLLRYYTKKRQSEGRNEHNTIRKLESLARIAVAHAKLMGHTETTDEDVYAALILSEYGLGSASSGAYPSEGPFESQEKFCSEIKRIFQEYGLDDFIKR